MISGIGLGVFTFEIALTGSGVPGYATAGDPPCCEMGEARLELEREIK
jgi:hypothetical protein